MIGLGVPAVKVVHICIGSGDGVPNVLGSLEARSNGEPPHWTSGVGPWVNKPVACHEVVDPPPHVEEFHVPMKVTTARLHPHEEVLGATSTSLQMAGTFAYVATP